MRPKSSTRFTIKLHNSGMNPSDIAVMNEPDIRSRDRKIPFIGIFFGYPSVSDANHPILPDLIADSVVIIPLVDDLRSASNYVPPLLAHINCLASSRAAPNTPRIVSLIFENFRLLRSERRLFISYKRSEAQGVAIQLYEKFGMHSGFDVFLISKAFLLLSTSNQFFGTVSRIATLFFCLIRLILDRADGPWPNWLAQMQLAFKSFIFYGQGFLQDHLLGL